ncbi:hypothetical protein DPMN_166297 [Dreissena polymorpha]|uniref:Uncharacterized protein n=1 Tax=Dreissena polymorpha TaxID=45954 RepID=A0A9D4IVD0_DREPO|nr:hypothetical protein DPMN_166297 [Dreissena polymorpha]
MWCPPSNRGITDSIPTLGAFLRSPPMTPSTGSTQTQESSNSQIASMLQSSPAINGKKKKKRAHGALR